MFGIGSSSLTDLRSPVMAMTRFWTCSPEVACPLVGRAFFDRCNSRGCYRLQARLQGNADTLPKETETDPTPTRGPALPWGGSHSVGPMLGEKTNNEKHEENTMHVRQLLREMKSPKELAHLAETSNLTEAELEEFASGDKGIPLSTACQICEAMGVQTVHDIDVDVKIDWLRYHDDLWNVVKEDCWQRWLQTHGDRQWPMMLGEGFCHESEYED
jgi:hypothetical protein